MLSVEGVLRDATHYYLCRDNDATMSPLSTCILTDQIYPCRSAVHSVSLSLSISLSLSPTTTSTSVRASSMMATATPNNNGNGNKNGKPTSGDVEVGESTPLLQTANSGDDNNGNNTEPPPLQEMKAESLKERAVAVTAGVSFLSSIAAIIFEATAHPVVWVSGILGAILAPYAAMQQQKLTQVEALNQTNERMEQEVEQLAAENVRLSKQVQEMEESVIKYVYYGDCYGSGNR
jgi:cell division protein FtsB